MDLSKLKERIQTQLAYEYHDEDRQRHEFENLTVARLLEMLEYMGQEP